MKKSFERTEPSVIQQEGRANRPPALQVVPCVVGFRRTQWPDVSAIAYSHSTNDESIEEVLEELKTLSLKDFGSMDSKASEISTKALLTEQFEKAGLGRSRYSRVLRRVKDASNHSRFPTSLAAKQFAELCLERLKGQPASVSPVVITKAPSPEEGPARVIGSTDYSKWEDFKDEESEEQKQAKEMVRAMCSQDHRKERQIFERSTAEKLTASSVFKAQGNEAFKAQNYSLAALNYRKALMQLDYTFPDTPSEKQTFEELNLSLCLNMAAAKWFLEDYDETLNMARQALKLSPDHPKALYRIAQVHVVRDQFDEASSLLKRLLVLQPSSPEVRNLELKLRKAKEAYHIKKRQVAAAMLSS